MGRLSSIEDFHKWQSKLKAAVDPDEQIVTICGGTGCTALGSAQVYAALEQQIQKHKLSGRVRLKRTGCHGFCEKGPVAVILPKQFFYCGIEVDDVEEVIEKTVLAGESIERLQYVDPKTGNRVVYEYEVPFYAGQQRNVFRYNGKIDPVIIEDYVAAGGYSALAKALQDYSPERIIRRRGLSDRAQVGALQEVEGS
jgi:NADH-quinone oxidoreductase subunit F